MTRRSSRSLPRGFEVWKGPWHSLVDVLFPPRCQSCGRVTGKLTAGIFCETCTGEIQYINPPLCPVCGAPHGAGEGGDRLCRDCLTTPKPFQIARSAAVYAGGLLQVIHRFKYHHHPELGAALGQLLLDGTYAGLPWEDFTVLVPVPLHIRRLRERGFNQALLMARTLSARCGVPVDFLSLERERDTPPQTRMGRRERRENIRGAFVVARREMIRGQRVLLIDDVYTTGSTLAECARVLLDSGAARVGVLTLARALPDG